MTGRHPALFAGGILFAIYVITLAPGVTFWDAGEFIAAANGLGIPHPPGTPLFVAIGRVWTMALGPMVGVARASNLLSAACTAIAGALLALVMMRELRAESGARWAVVTAVLCAGLGTSVWANATETEVYAVSLLLTMAMLAAAARVARDDYDGVSRRWILVTAYLFALAPALHLSALVGAPAAIALAARRDDGSWRRDRVALLLGVAIAGGGLGVMSWPVIGVGAAIACLSSALAAEQRWRRALSSAAALGFVAVGASALLIMLVRARHDPLLNQGDPSTLSSLVDVVSRRQYDLAPMWPRRAPVWLQLANVFQYADWQFGMTLGNGIFTSVQRVAAMSVFLMLGVVGWSRMRALSPRLALSLALLTLCGTLGVAAYLNLRAGASIGYGMVPPDAHEARERDYFFVLGFWAWGAFAGFGAWSLARARGRPAFALLAAAVPLVANWPVNDRAHAVARDAPRRVAEALLSSVPKDGLLFIGGDNDTYPIWYLQQVEGFRRDVVPVTLPLLAADWYYEQVLRRAGLRASSTIGIQAHRIDELRSGAIARAAFAIGRPVTASTQLTALQREVLGSNWQLVRFVYLAAGTPGAAAGPPQIGRAGAFSTVESSVSANRRDRLPDDVSEVMLQSLTCGSLAHLPPGRSSARMSLESRCNFR